MGAEVEQGACMFSSVLYAKPDEVWVPDILPLNSVIDSDQVEQTGIEVYPGGGRWYSRPMDIKFSDLNITVQNYPFDKQRVTLAMGSWTYNKNQMGLKWSGTTTPGGQPAFGEGASESEKVWQQCENRPCRDKCIKSKSRLMSGNVDETTLDRDCKQLCKECDTFGWASDDSFYFSKDWCRKGQEDTGGCPIDFLRGTVEATGLGTLQNPVEWKFPGTSFAVSDLPTWQEREHIILANHSTKYPCCELPIPELEVSFTLQRRAPYHLWMTIFPMVVLSQLGLVIHILQGKSVESINWALGTSFTILLALYAHNIFLAENVPLLPLDSFVNVIFLQSLCATLLSALFTIMRYARAHDLDGNEHLHEGWIDFLFDQYASHVYLALATVYAILTIMLMHTYGAPWHGDINVAVFWIANVLIYLFIVISWSLTTGNYPQCCNTLFSAKHLSDREFVDFAGQSCSHDKISSDFERIFYRNGRREHLDEYKVVFFKNRIAPSQLARVSSAANLSVFEVLQKMHISLVDSLEMTSIIEGVEAASLRRSSQLELESKSTSEMRKGSEASAQIIVGDPSSHDSDTEQGPTQLPGQV